MLYSPGPIHRRDNLKRARCIQTQKDKDNTCTTLQHQWNKNPIPHTHTDGPDICLTTYSQEICQLWEETRSHISIGIMSQSYKFTTLCKFPVNSPRGMFKYGLHMQVCKTYHLNRKRIEMNRIGSHTERYLVLQGHVYTPYAQWTVLILTNSKSSSLIG